MGIRAAAFSLLLAGCGLTSMRPTWMPERPTIASTWYDGLLERRLHTIAIERPDRAVKQGRELVLSTTFTDPEVRAWAARAKQVDVIDYEIVVLHQPGVPIPPAIDARRDSLVDGRMAFVLDDGTWVFAAMGYADHVKARLKTSTPSPLPIPDDVNQLFLINGRSREKAPPPCKVTKQGVTFCFGPIMLGEIPPALEWVLLATKTDGSYVTHAHYTNEKAMETSPRPHLAVTEETWRSGNELYMRGY